MKIYLTERDLDILDWINKFGFITDLPNLKPIIFDQNA